MPVVRRIGDIYSAMDDIIDIARSQDAERLVRDDDIYFEATGENRLTLPVRSNVLVEDDTRDNSDNHLNRLAISAYNQREIISKERKEEEKKRQYAKALELFESKYKNSIMILDLE